MLLTLCTTLLGFMEENNTKRWLLGYTYMLCFNFLSTALSSVVQYNNLENRPSSGGICVANHTSPIDVLVLMCDGCYALVSILKSFGFLFSLLFLL